MAKGRERTRAGLSRPPRRVTRIFAAALRYPTERRISFLDRACQRNGSLRREVESLLSHHKTSDSFLNDPAYVSAPALFLDQTEPETERSFEIGQQIGPFQIENVLGEGGMGIVYRAWQSAPVRRWVALKVIKAGMDTRAVLTRFEQERQALALLNHPSIAQVFDAGSTHEGRPYFAMEYVVGQPITDYCDGARLTIRERLTLFVQVCDAVQHAHQKGIIHRDLKPSNVLIHEDGGRPIPKIIDFGVAKSTQGRLTGSTLYTECGVLIGTPAFMSPEQADPRFGIDTRSDIYSLGVLLYHLLTSLLPIDVRVSREDDLVQVHRRILFNVPPAPSAGVQRAEDPLEVAASRRTVPRTLVHQIRGELDWITLKALEKDPARRYSSASEFAADIQRYLNNEQVLASPPSRSYRLRKLIDRHRTAVVFTLTLVAVLMAGFATSTYLLLANRRATKLAQEQRADILRLSDRTLLDQCLVAADTLWPAYPRNIPGLQQWLSGPARELAERFPIHRRKLRDFSDTALPISSSATAVSRVTGSGSSSLLDPESGAPAVHLVLRTKEEQFQYDLLRDLVRGLEVFLDPNPALGTVAKVKARLEFALAIEERSVNAHCAEWDHALASIADVRQCPAYRGLSIVPQLGLVPIGRDPRSGLWEFAHLQSGAIPTRDDYGNLIHTEEMGIVFVLLPGGEFQMGAERESVPGGVRAARSGRGEHTGQPNEDPLAHSDEGPVHTVRLDPFFISKFEMTQGQWLRFTHHNPSREGPGVIWAGHRHTLLHPVEQIGWKDAQLVLSRLGLQLPTEAQWEYASRAGTSTVWYTGNDKKSLRSHANLVDQSIIGVKPPGWPNEAWNDGFADSAPVGSYLPNPFGLHDTIGNVWEWCRDYYLPYDRPLHPGDGGRLGRSDRRVSRGGGFACMASGTRHARREGFFPENAIIMGVRPSREVDLGWHWVASRGEMDTGNDERPVAYQPVGRLSN